MTFTICNSDTIDGHLIMNWSCEQHHSLGIDRFDLLIGDTVFKSARANGSYDVATITATPRGLPIRRWLLAAADRRSEFARHTLAPRVNKVHAARFSPAARG